MCALILEYDPVQIQWPTYAVFLLTHMCALILEYDTVQVSEQEGLAVHPGFARRGLCTNPDRLERVGVARVERLRRSAL